MQDPKKKTSSLSQEDKSKLDGNIKKMLENGASKEDVLKYASDFKNRFGVKKKENSSVGSSADQNLELDGAPQITFSDIETSEQSSQGPPSYMLAEKSQSETEQKDPFSFIDPTWRAGDYKRNLSAETMAEYQNWKSQSTLTPEEMEDVNSRHKSQLEGDFGLIDNIANWFRKTPSSINPFYNPEAVTKPKSKEELVREKVKKKQSDFLNNLDSPEKREKIKTLVQIENWEEDEKRNMVDRKLSESANRLKELDQSITPLLTRKKELESIELPPDSDDQQLKSFQDEYLQISRAIADMQREGKKVYEDYEQSMDDYAEHTENIGRFEDELGMLKRDYQFLSNAGNILGLGTAEIVSDLKFQGERLGNVIANTILNQPELLESQKELFENQAIIRKNILDKQREYLTPTVSADDIQSVGDFIDFATNGILENTPTLVQLGLPYVGQASFVASQQANSEIGIRQNIKKDKEELAEINDVLENADSYNLSDAELVSFAKRKKQLEYQETPSESSILMASSAMAASELLLGKIGSIRLVNKAKRTAKSIGQNTLTPGIKKSYSDKLNSGLSTAFDFTKDVAGEGFEELGVGIVGNIADIYLLDRKYNEDGSRKNILDGSFGNTLGGLSTGAGLSGATKTLGYAAREISDFKRRKAVVGNVKQINNYLEMLSDPELSSEVRLKVEDAVKRLNQKNGAIIKNVVDVFNGLSEQENKKVIDINNAISANEIAIEELVKKGDGDSELVDSLKSQINALDSEKADLLDKNTTIESSTLSLLPKATQQRLKQQAADQLKEEYDKSDSSDADISESDINKKANEIINSSSDLDQLSNNDQTAQPLINKEQKDSNVQNSDENQIKNKSTDELEKRQAEIEDSKNDRQEFNRIDNELEKREWQSVLNSPLDKIDGIVDNLMTKNKTMPNGFGSYIERADAMETKKIAKKYINGVDKQTALKDFKDAFFGNPSKWYADGLKLRESVASFVSQGGTFKELLMSVQKEFEGDGFTEKDAAKVIKRKLDEISKINEAQTQGDSAANGNVRSESGVSVQQRQDNQTQPSAEPKRSKIETKIDPESTTIKKVKSLKGAEYDVEFDQKGNITKVSSTKDGREIPKFVERKVKPTKKNPKGVKLVKNGNYSKIVADATGAITENQSNQERKQKVAKALDEFTPTNAYEAALSALASGRKVSLESARKSTGLSTNEVKYVTGFKSENELPSIEALSEKITEDSVQELDQLEVRDALIEIIRQNNSILDIEDSLVESVDADMNQAEELELEAYLNSLSDKEYAQYISQVAEEDYLSELTNDEKLEYYEQQYGQEEIQRIDGERKDSAQGPQKSPRQKEQSRPEPESESGLDSVISNLENLKKEIDNSTKGTLGINIAPAVAKAAIDIVIQSLKAGKTLAKAIQDGINHIKSTDWYKKLSKSEKKETLRQFEQSMVQNTNTPEQNKQYVEDVFQANDNQINKKKSKSKRFRDGLRNLIQKYSDRQFVAKVLLDRSGMQSVKDLMINAHGSSGKAKRIYDKAYEEIYADKVKTKGGKVELRLLSQSDRDLLDKIIMLKRFVAIDEHRKKNNLPPVTHPGFINAQVAKDALDQYKNEVGKKKFSDLESRAKAYFDVYGRVLKDMYDNGLISKESYDSLNGVDYQPRQFLKHITDFEGNVSLGGAIKGVKDTGGLSKDQINSLKEGSEGALIRNSEWLLSTTIAGRYKAMAMNNVNKKFIKEAYPKAKKRFQDLKKKPKKDWTKEDKRFYDYFNELDKKIKDNPVIEINENGTAVRVFDKTPDNFKKAYYYENGVRNEFFIEENLHDSWFDNIDGFLSSDAKSFIQSASGAALLKAIATGNNPTFPIVNTPRDFAFLTIFSTQYSSFLPKAMLQVGKDSIKAVKEIFVSNQKNVSPENLFNKYIEYGGDMTFLSKQGRIKEGSMINKSLRKLFGPRFKHVGGKMFNALTLQKISTYSEMMFRIALMDRSIKNELKSRGFKEIGDVKDQNTLNEIYNRAVADARGILDFNQGGSFTKDAESFIPYLNTAVQGTRVMADAISKDPEKVIFKMVQAGAMMSGFSIGASLMLISALRDPEDDEDKNLSAAEIYLKAQQGISKYQRIQYMNIVTGNKNEDGQYQILKIAKTQPMAPLLSLTDNVTNHVAATMAGVDKKDTFVSYSEIGMAINNNLAPIDISFLGALVTDDSLIEGVMNSMSGTITRTPITKAALTYATGYDFYREQNLTYDTEKDMPWMDGANDKNIEDFYKKFGRANTVSPARLKGAVESFITTPSTNPFVGMLYGGADYITASDGSLKSTAEDFYKTMRRSTTKRVIGYTSEFNREVNKMAPFKSELKKTATKNKYDIIDMKNDVRQAWDNEIDAKELVSRVSKYSLEVRKKMANEIKSLAKKGDVPRYVTSLKFESDKEVRAMRILRFYGDIDDPDFKSTEDFVKMVEVGVLDKETLAHYARLLKENKKK